MTASSSACTGSTSRYAIHSTRAAARATPTSPRSCSAARRLLHEVAELHRRRARGLAPAALHALVHRGHERVVDRRAVELDSAHRGDAAARRRDLEPGDAVGRAVREAQPARDARDELVGVEAAAVPRLGRVAHSGSRPGASLPVGVERVLDAAHQLRVRQRDARTRRGRRRPASRSSQPPCSCAAARARGEHRRRRRPRRARCRRRARRTSARRRRVERARRSRRARRAATEIRPRCAPSGSAGAVALARGPADCASTSAASPSSRTHTSSPSHSIAAGAEAVDAARRRGTSARASARGPAAQRHLHEHAERAERADEQARQVVAGDVLDRRARRPSRAGRRR